MTRVRPWMLLAALMTLTLTVAVACGDDGGDPVADGDTDVVEDGDMDPEPEAEPEPEPEPEPAIEYESCGSNSDCPDWEMCITPGWCKPATGSMQGSIEIAVPDQEAGIAGGGPAYAVGNYRGESLYIGAEVAVDNILDRELGFVVQITITEMLSATVYDNMIIRLRKDMVASDTTVSFEDGAFVGELVRSTIEDDERINVERAHISGGTVSYAYANSEKGERIVGTFKFDLTGTEQE